MDIHAAVAALTEEAERQLRDGAWEVGPGDRALARKAAAGLAEAVGEQGERQGLPEGERLEDLREALAVLAITLARTHGRLAWFLAGASTALSPVLHWRSLPAERGSAFGTVVATPEQYADGETAVRCLRNTLTRIAAFTSWPGTRPPPRRRRRLATPGRPGTAGRLVRRRVPLGAFVQARSGAPTWPVRRSCPGEQAAQVAGEASAQARDLLAEARTQVRDQARAQTGRLAGNVRRLAHELRDMPDHGKPDPTATAAVAQLADGGHRVADRLEERGPDGLLEDVQDFARRRPGLFLAGAALAGFGLGRTANGVAAAGEPAVTRDRSHSSWGSRLSAVGDGRPGDGAVRGGVAPPAGIGMCFHWWGLRRRRVRGWG
ncbi:hypothetical protein [Kitasatospora herbaricolor]|uniref:Uncharacterized protein n=1 Tax=Kitasatospora herbaricolor TaxID=68217 RepID=A0ABZ1WHG4_9ACTN|nr:hypothetical protein [Kitasatospora herbaricolor]